MWKHKMSREDVARRSGHDFGHVLELFDQDDPNPTLRFYLDLLEAAGARMDTANGNSVEHVVTRLGELRKRAGLSIAELARRSGMRRPHLSGIINGSRANMQLAVFDVLVTVLGAEGEMMLVDRWHLSQEVLLALAAGDETIAVGDGKPHLHVVPNGGSTRQAGVGEAPRVTASHPGGAASAAAPPLGPPDDDEKRAAQEKARAEQARARAAALAADRAAWAEQERAERAEQARARAEAREREERAEQERLAQEQAEAAARAAAVAAAATRAVLQNKMMVGTGIVLAIVGGVCIAKGVAGLRSSAA